METKKCSKCGIEKTLKDFGRNKSRPDGYQTWCKECLGKNYSENREKYRKKQKEYNVKNKEKIRTKAKETANIIKKNLIERTRGKCENCGGDFYQAALCFHHICPVEKELLHLSGASEIKQIEECSKTMLLCQNCHHILHAEETERNHLGDLIVDPFYDNRLLKMCCHLNKPRTFYSPEAKAWIEKTERELKEQWKGAPYKAEVELDIFWTDIFMNKGDGNIKKKDIDSILKPILNVMSGIVYIDDSQVFKNTVRKIHFVGEGTGKVRIKVYKYEKPS